MSLRVVVGSRTDDLVELMAAELSERPLGCFEPEVVWVPTNGVERWLSQRLARRLGARTGSTDGVSADIEFVRPGRFLQQRRQEVLAAAQGHRAHLGWEAGTLSAAVLAVLEADATEPALESVSQYLGLLPGWTTSARRRRRFPFAQNLAHQFLRYGEERPTLLAGDADCEQWPADLAWQAHLLRRLGQRLGPSPAEQSALLQASIRDGVPGTLARQPQRLWYVGPSRINALEREYLEALAQHREVVIAVPAMAAQRFVTQARLTSAAPLAEPSAALGAGRNRLVAACNRELDELAGVVADRGWPVQECGEVAEPWPGDSPTNQTNLLAALRRSVRDDVAHDAAPRLADGSIQVHRCAGQLRQVEVLRDVLCAAFAELSDLEPREVVVMCPEVERFAPTLLAAFDVEVVEDDAGPSATLAHPAHQLSVRIADRAMTESNPVAQAVNLLLQLPSARQSVDEVVAWLSLAPVRRALRLSEDDLDLVLAWAEASAISWGVDEKSRAAEAGSQLRQGTWRWGLDRLALGAALEPEVIAEVDAAPVSVESAQLAVLGRVTAALRRLGEWCEFALAGPHAPSAWADRLADEIRATCEVTWSEAWQLQQAQELLTDFGADSSGAPLDLADLRFALAPGLAARPTRTGFQTGHLTICSLAPMRAVAHRVVVLLGLDAGTFPSTPGQHGDDVLARGRRLGERDRRAEDLQLFLSACLHATERLVIIDAGQDSSQGHHLAPSPATSALLDAVRDLGADPEAVLVRHEVRPYSPEEYSGSVGRTSFDASAAASRRVPRRREATATGPDQATADALDLADLIRFWTDPGGTYLKRGIGLGQAKVTSTPEPQLPLELQGLGQWQAAKRLLKVWLDGAADDVDEVARAVEAELATQGRLPPGTVGVAALARTVEELQPLLGGVAGWRAHPPRTVAIEALVEGRMLVGSLVGVRAGVQIEASASRLRAKQRLTHFIRHVAWQATTAQPVRSMLFGRCATKPWRFDGPTEDFASTLLEGYTQAQARAVLAFLIRGRELGLAQPLPILGQTSLSLAVAAGAGGDPATWVHAGQQSWRAPGFQGWTGEFAQPAHELLWPTRHLNDLAAHQLPGWTHLLGPLQQGWPELAVADRPVAAWSTLPPLLGLALAVWRPLLALERTRGL